MTVEVASDALGSAVRSSRTDCPGAIVVGLKTPVTPAGSPVTDRVHGPFNVPCMSTVNSAVSPTGNNTIAGSSERLTSGDVGGGPFIVMMEEPSVPQPVENEKPKMRSRPD